MAAIGVDKLVEGSIPFLTQSPLKKGRREAPGGLSSRFPRRSRQPLKASPSFPLLLRGIFKGGINGCEAIENRR